METLLRTSVFLWISVGFLSAPEKSEACPSAGFPPLCQYVFRNVCYEFVRELKTWSQARSSCEEQRGELLTVLDSPLKIFLENITTGNKTCNFTWWLGKGVGENNQEPTIQHGDLCTYMKTNPLHVNTSNCSQKRGFLCTHSLKSPPETETTVVSNYTRRLRLKRDLNAMASKIDSITGLLEAADLELERMELTKDEPTNDNRKKFIEYLLAGTLKVTPVFARDNKDVMTHIINCSTAILALSLKKCDIATNPNPTTLFEDVFQILRKVSDLLGSDSTPSIIRHPRGTIYQSSHKPTDLSNAVLGSEEDDAFIKLPSYSALERQLGRYSKVSTQLSTFVDNPFPSDDNVSGTVCSLILSNEGKDIEVKDLSEMIEIYLPRPNASVHMNISKEMENNTYLLSNFNVTDTQLTVFFDVEPSADVSLILSLNHKSPPEPTRFRHQKILNQTEGYRWMISPDMIADDSGMWYVDVRSVSSMWQEGLTLRITSFTSKCLYWHKEKKKWSTEGCQVGMKSTPEQTQCLCNHLTLFGSSFFVMPNNVDISRTAELFATVTDNYVVLALLCAFFGLYLITLLWACYADRRALSKRKMTLLEDNHPGAQYNYLIGIQTGHRKNAGTSANVMIKLIGSDGESSLHVLTDPDKPVFERGAFDMFLLAAPYPLGDVGNLRLQHDNSGGHPSWYVDKVTIQDVQTRNIWHFFCDCWLSADRGDGATKKTFNAAKSNEIASFRNIFQSRTSTGFRDEHIWVSIVSPPSRSPFTRAQRVSCCMSLLLCTMAINIAFWNLPVDESSPVIFSLGSMQITWQEIMVGVQSGLLMFPINILIITIFRSIRPRMVSDSKKGDAQNARPPVVTIPSILKETEEVISLVSQSRRNKISDVSRLESAADLWPALDKVHEFLQLMQGENESDPHWVCCSKFLLAGLSRLLMCLGRLDANTFPNPYDHQQAINITSVLVRKAEMVFSSHLAYCPPPVRTEKKKSTSCWLPWWFVFLGWFLLLSISGISTFFTLLYGFEYGKEKSIKWVMSLGLSLFQSIFILQPLKVLGVAVIFALLLKPVAVEETEEVDLVLIKQQEKCRQWAGRSDL